MSFVSTPSSHVRAAATSPLPIQYSPPLESQMECHRRATAPQQFREPFGFRSGPARSDRPAPPR